jgi:sulfite exporter TauE/SafE
MFVFGLTTAPALLAVVGGFGRLQGRAGRVGARLAAPALVLFGLFTVARGGGVFVPRAAAPVLPDCCAER